MLYVEDKEFSSSPIEFSILVPCLNERENIGAIIDDLNGVLQGNALLDRAEILILDDSSTDGTYDQALQRARHYPDLSLRVIRRHEPRRGYGAIIRFGIAIARGRYCVPVSADRVDPIELLPVMLEKMRNGADAVQCSRYIQAQDAATIPFKYKFFQHIWRFLLRVFLRQKIADSTYSFKMFKRVEILALGIESNGFSISPEIFFKFLLMGGNIEYVSHGQGVRENGESKFLFTREGFGYSYVLLRTWFHRLGILWF